MEIGLFGCDYDCRKFNCGIMNYIIWEENMKKRHPLLFNLVLTMAIQICVYLIIIFDTQIIEPILQLMGVRSQGIMAPTEVIRFLVISVAEISAAIVAGTIRSKVYFWLPSFLLIFIGFAIFYPDILPTVNESNFPNFPWFAEYLGYGTKKYSAICQAVVSFIYQLLPYTVTRILLFRRDCRRDDCNNRRFLGKR